MSFDALRLVCTGCDYEDIEPFQPHRVVYQSKAGNEVYGRSAAGWCYECGGYSKIECMDLKALLAELAELEDASARHQAELDSLSQKYFFNFARRSAKRRLVEDEVRSDFEGIANLQHLCAIVLQRSSKPRCLVCGSSDTADLDFENGETRRFRHRCGGRLSLGAHPRGLRINFGRTVRCYVLDQQGNPIETRLEQRIPSQILKS